MEGSEAYSTLPKFFKPISKTQLRKLFDKEDVNWEFDQIFKNQHMKALPSRAQGYLRLEIANDNLQKAFWSFVPTVVGLGLGWRSRVRAGGSRSMIAEAFLFIPVFSVVSPIVHQLTRNLPTIDLNPFFLDAPCINNYQIRELRERFLLKYPDRVNDKYDSVSLEDMARVAEEANLASSVEKNVEIPRDAMGMYNKDQVFMSSSDVDQFQSQQTMGESPLDPDFTDQINMEGMDPLKDANFLEDLRYFNRNYFSRWQSFSYFYINELQHLFGSSSGMQTDVNPHENNISLNPQLMNRQNHINEMNAAMPNSHYPRVESHFQQRPTHYLASGYQHAPLTHYNKHHSATFEHDAKPRHYMWKSRIEDVKPSQPYHGHYANAHGFDHYKRQSTPYP